jgi:hypothetical protein
MSAMKFRGARVASLILACSLALTACGGDDDGKDRKTDEPTGPATTAKTDDGITEPGSELELGETATVVWAPNQKLKSTIAVTLTRIDQGTAKDIRAIKIDPPLKNPRLYYARFTLENKGTTDLGGLTPLALLYLDDGSDVLEPAALLRVKFKPCALKKLPAKFGQGKKADLCLVYAVDTDLKNISLRPNETDAMITWTGKITKPVPAKKKPRKQG